MAILIRWLWLFAIVLVGDAAPNPTKLTDLTEMAIVRQVAMKRLTTTDVSRVGNLTRQHDGDVFDAFDDNDCNADVCIGLSSGTAGLYKKSGGVKEMDLSQKKQLCKCQCHPHLTTYREDVSICVDDIHECTLAPFVSGSSSEKIPFVFLPLHGQIIHPSREINFPGVQTPICAVTGSQFLTKTGWSELRNPIDSDVPFRLFRDEGRTFLQWLGTNELRSRMEGRLILVHLLCRDVAPISLENLMPFNENNTDPQLPKEQAAKGGTGPGAQNMFTPCVAFRIVGTPVKHVNNVTEVLFQSESSSASSSEGLSTKEYVVIGICSLLLGLIYVASVLLYIHMKKRRRNNANNQANASMSTLKTTETNNYNSKNDQVTFGSGFHPNGNSNIYGSKSRGSLGSSRNSQRGGGGSVRSVASTGEEIGIVKSNPLLKHFPNLNDSGEFDSNGNSNSEFDDEHKGNSDKNSKKSDVDDADGHELGLSSNQEEDCLPEENVSIIEDMTADEKLESMKAIVSGTLRRKLYFNPAYFEPDLLVSPPPAAIEFLNKIREVITIAKYKMATKRYQPSLIDIPEELQASTSELYGRQAQPLSRKSSVLSKGTSKRKDCSGCPGCETAGNPPNGESSTTSTSKSTDPDSNCKNCGDKRNSIRRWLEGVSTGVNAESESSDTEKAISLETTKDDSEKKQPEATTTAPAVSNNSDSSSVSDTDTIKANSVKSKSTKGKAPPVPSSASAPPASPPPKIVSHSLKKNPKTGLIKTPSPPTSPPHPTTPPPPPPVAKQQTPLYQSKSEIYNKLKSSEIYNNPQFKLGSPELPPRNMHPPRHGQRMRPPKNIEVFDQFSNQSQYELFKNMPDMVYEALANDYNMKNNTYSSSPYGSIKLPTPDYNDDDTAYEAFKFKNRSGTESPYVPTPDYNTYGRSKKGYQPDSPIYTRKSPHFLIVDYETDSLERGATTKSGKMLTSSSSDMSSHPSPSLSAALPLEEEMEIRNAVYDKVEGFRKDTDTSNLKRNNSNRSDYSMVSEIYVPNDRQNFTRNGSKIMYNVPHVGSMTIELDHIPTDYELSTDSDQFEPDTLDRKPKLRSRGNNNKEVRTWNERFMNSAIFGINNEENNYASMENMTSLPDLNYLTEKKNRLVLRSSGSFKSDGAKKFNQNAQNFLNNRGGQTRFGSLREIYEAKNTRNNQRPALTQIDFMDKGRMLALDVKHSKRQRQISEATLQRQKKNIPPPDVVPVRTMAHPQSIYDHPKRSNSLLMAKNLTAWNTSELAGKDNGNFNDENDDEGEEEEDDGGDTLNHDTDTCETTSTNSESTEFTGVSETNANSEFETDRRILANKLEFMQNNKEYAAINKLSKFYEKNDFITQQDGCYINEMEGKPSFGILENFMSVGQITNKHFPMTSDLFSCNSSPIDNEQVDSNNNSSNHHQKSSLGEEEEEDVEVGVVLRSSQDKESKSKESTLKSRKISNESFNSSNYEPFNHLVNPKVYRVEINHSTNGMQIALGLKDRNKKSKDIKNAWKKFMNKATSKFGSQKAIDPLEGRLENDDEGIASMIDEHSNISSRVTAAGLPGKLEVDSGYISADSSESKIYGRKFYERFNFKQIEQKLNESAYIDLDVVEESKFDDERDDNDDDDDHDGNGADENHNYDTINPQMNNGLKVASQKSEIICSGEHSIIEIKDYPAISFDTTGYKVGQLCAGDEDEVALSSELDTDEEDSDEEDVCESGAESVETHSVFFKQVRKY